jgi:hypothetical protein
VPYNAKKLSRRFQRTSYGRSRSSIQDLQKSEPAGRSLEEVEVRPGNEFRIGRFGNEIAHGRAGRIALVRWRTRELTDHAPAFILRRRLVRKPRGIDYGEIAWQPESLLFRATSAPPLDAFDSLSSMFGCRITP